VPSVIFMIMYPANASQGVSIIKRHTVVFLLGIPIQTLYIQLLAFGKSPVHQLYIGLSLSFFVITLYHRKMRKSIDKSAKEHNNFLCKRQKFKKYSQTGLQTGP